MKVALVYGGRDYWDWVALYEVLDEERPDLIITGDATGADATARRWAAKNRVALIVGKAEWEMYGRAAGPIRNEDMANKFAALVQEGAEGLGIECPGGKGTADMHRRLAKINARIRYVAREKTGAVAT